MSDPILFVVDHDAVTLASLAGALERRFGSDYGVLSDRSPRAALAGSSGPAKRARPSRFSSRISGRRK